MSEARRRALLYGVGVVFAGALLFAGFGITVPPDPGTRLSGASFLAAMGEYDDALVVCAQVLEEHPGNIDALIFRATFLAMAERHDEAILAYDAAFERVVDEQMRRDIVVDRASVLLRAGRLDEFRKERDRVARMGSDHRTPLLEGLAAEHARDWDGAVLAYRTALERKPGDPSLQERLWVALVEEGREALAEGQFERAGRAFDAARSLVPAATEGHLLAAEVRLAEQDATGALGILRSLGARTSGVAPLVFRAATQLLVGGDRTGALDALGGALVADDETTRALLEKEPVWNAIVSDRDVRAVLETKQEAAPVELTGQG